MLKKVLSNNDCNSLVELSEKIGLVKNLSGWKFSEAVIEHHYTIDKLVKVFESKMGYKVKGTPLMRVLKLNVNDKLTNYNFDYSALKTNFLKDTSFGVQVMLNDNFNGGTLTLRGVKQEYSAGDGTILNRSTKAKVSTIKEGQAYISLLHIFNLNTNNLI